MHIKYIFLLILFINTSLYADICSRSTPVKEKILKMLDTLNCKTVTNEDLSSITDSIYISKTNYETIRKDDFKGLFNVYSLHLDSNNISTISNGAFRDLKNIQILGLQNNKIKKVEKNLFKGLDNLRVLRLWNNGLNAIEDSSFTPLSKLELLNLSNNNLRDITSRTFEGLFRLETLFLNNNQIVSKDVPFFFLGTQLIELDLSFNYLTGVYKSNFNALKRLRKLNLRGNVIKKIEENSFQDLKKLNQLTVSGNKIESITTNIFSGLENLKYFYIHGNPISEVQSKYLNVFKSLKEMSIKTKSICSFSFLPQVITGNPISISQLRELEFNSSEDLLNVFQCQTLSIEKLRDEFDSSMPSLLIFNLLSNGANISQVELEVPKLKYVLTRDYLHSPITSLFGHSFIPSIDGRIQGINYVRLLAVEVCNKISSFCPVREEIHEYPTRLHLELTTKLKNELISNSASVDRIALVEKLETGLMQMFSISLEYDVIRDLLEDSILKDELDIMFSRVLKLDDISKICLKITEEIKKKSLEWRDQYLFPYLKIKAYLVSVYRDKFWKMDSKNRRAQLNSLIEVTKANHLLSSREATMLRKDLSRGRSIESIVKKSIKWQLNNIDREFKKGINQSGPLAPNRGDPMTLMSNYYEKVVRTSMISEWNNLLN